MLYTYWFAAPEPSLLDVYNLFESKFAAMPVKVIVSEVSVSKL
jgi:hypothetical protein